MVGSVHDLRVGERVGDYRIRSVLGRGGAGTVYKADGPAGGVALKLMHEHDPSGVGRKRFDREAALVQRFRHPHVVALIGYGYTQGGLPYIVFELLVGRSMKSKLRRSGPFETRAAGRVALQLLDALIAAHAMGIIHRDIKPANVLMCEGYEADHVKVLDFGLAKAIEGEGAEIASITDTGYRLGTPRYMSPEMARGNPVGAAGDIYGLGLVFAEMLIGKPVVQSTRQIEVLMMHANKDPLPLGEIVQQSPFATCICRALAKEQEDRYPSARAMRGEVAQALGYHEQALQLVQQFPDEPMNAETLVIHRVRSSSAADPLATTDELDPTPRMPLRPIAPGTSADDPGGPQGHGGATAPQGHGGATAPQGHGGAAAPQGHGGAAAPQGHGGAAAPQVEVAVVGHAQLAETIAFPQGCVPIPSRENIDINRSANTVPLYRLASSSVSDTPRAPHGPHAPSPATQSAAPGLRNETQITLVVLVVVIVAALASAVAIFIVG